MTTQHTSETAAESETEIEVESETETGTNINTNTDTDSDTDSPHSERIQTDESAQADDPTQVDEPTQADDPTIAVTGAAGYIGSRVVGDLQRIHPEWSITAIDNFYRGTIREIGDVPVEHVDVRNRDRLWDALEGADVVLHLAAISGVDDCAGRPDLAYAVNVTGTSHVARFCHSRQTPLVFPASMSIIGDPDPEAFPIAADDDRDPLNWYGRTKLLGERLLDSLADEAFPAHMFLKSNLYGTHLVDGQRVSKGTVINFFVDRALAGDTLTVYEPGTQARNFVHVEDVARAYVRSSEVLLERHRNGDTGLETYTIASDEDPSVREIADHVREIAREEAGLEPAVELVENPRSAETLVDHFPVDTTRTRDSLDWEATRTVADSVRQLVRARTSGDVRSESEPATGSDPDPESVSGTPSTAEAGTGERRGQGQERGRGQNQEPGQRQGQETPDVETEPQP